MVGVWKCKSRGIQIDLEQSLGKLSGMVFEENSLPSQVEGTYKDGNFFVFVFFFHFIRGKQTNKAIKIWRKLEGSLFSLFYDNYCQYI